jgi:hypothetical protein
LVILHFYIADIRSPDPQARCVTATTVIVFIVFASTNIICDIISIPSKDLLTEVFILPFFLLKQLQRLSRRQIWGLSFIFGLGGITVCTSIARTLAIAFMADIVHVGVWSVLEVGVGIVVACCPALRVLLRQAGDTVVPVSPRGRGTYVSHRTDSHAPIISGSRLQEIQNVGDDSTDTLQEITNENVVKQRPVNIERGGILNVLEKLIQTQ